VFRLIFVFKLFYLNVFQIACILNMVSSWRSHTRLRVFLPITGQSESTQAKEQKLSMFLRQLRILADIQTVNWEHIQHYLQDPNYAASAGDDNMDEGITEDDSGDKIQEYREVQ
jgi:hypothetical protein